MKKIPDAKIKRIALKKASVSKSVDEQEDGDGNEGEDHKNSENKVEKPKSHVHTRPIKVIFPTSWEKRKFLASLSRLKGSPYEKLHVAHDMNQEDRDKNKELLGEAYKLNQDKEKPSNFRYKVRGPLWAQKIVKVLIKN